MTDESTHSTGATERIPPLNLTEEEADYLWKMMVREVGKENVQYGNHRETVESLHTKVGEITQSFDTDTE